MAESNTNPPNQPIPTGWQCPNCGTVYNPTIKSCLCKAKVQMPEEGGKAINPAPFVIRPTIPVPTTPWFPKDPRKPMLGGQMPTSLPPTPYAKWDPIRQVWLNGCSASSCNCTGRCNQPVGSPDNLSGFSIGTSWNNE